MRKRGGRKRALGTRAPMAVLQGTNQRWSLDFFSDALTDSRLFRVLAVMDDFSRECLALIADVSLSGIRIARPHCGASRISPPHRQRQRHGVDLERDPKWSQLHLPSVYVHMSRLSNELLRRK